MKQMHLNRKYVYSGLQVFRQTIGQSAQHVLYLPHIARVCRGCPYSTTHSEHVCTYVYKPTIVEYRLVVGALLKDEAC